MLQTLPMTKTQGERSCCCTTSGACDSVVFHTCCSGLPAAFTSATCIMPSQRVVLPNIPLHKYLRTNRTQLNCNQMAQLSQPEHAIRLVLELVMCLVHSYSHWARIPGQSTCEQQQDRACGSSGFCASTRLWPHRHRTLWQQSPAPDL